MPTIGLSCWPTGDRRGCDKQFDIKVTQAEYKSGEGSRRLEAEAGRAGWCIGHWDGAGYFVCPEHKDSVWDAKPLLP